MAKIRRVNEGNVDLNRNFLAHGEDYTGIRRHKRLDHLLNPPHRRWTRLHDCAHTVMQILRARIQHAEDSSPSAVSMTSPGLFFRVKLEKAPRTLL